jgi:adenylate cyclase
MAEESPKTGEGNQEVQADMPHPGGESHDVFISYASQDAAIANAVVSALERAGVSCWIAPRDVVPGALYADGIIRAINDAKVLVLVLSANSIASPHVGKEVERASSKRRPIITLKVDSALLTTALEYFLSESQWIDLQEAGTEAGFKNVAEAVKRHKTPSSDIPPRESPSRRSLDSTGVDRKRSWMPLVLVAVLGIALAWSAVDKFWLSRNRSLPGPASTAVASISAISPASSVISDKSVAVLPFVDMSEKKDQEYFSDGMSEELINLLTKLPDLRVPARTSAFYFKGKPVTIADIAHALGVAYVLEGSVRKSGRTLRVTAQLIRADNGYHVWSETYDRPIDDIFKVQDEVAGAVVKALKVSLMGDAMPTTAGTQSLDAYNLYLQARSIWLHRSGRADDEKVIDYLQEALNTDPRFANAWAFLSDAKMDQESFGYVDADKADQDARSAAKRAIDLDPRLADGHVALAHILILHDWDKRGGSALIQEALALDPKNGWALNWAGDLATLKGRFDQGIDFALKGIESDPANPTRYRDLGNRYYVAGNYPESLKAFRKALDLNPRLPLIHFDMGRVMLAAGDPASALAETDHDSDRNVMERCACRMLAYDALGRKADADAALAISENRYADEDAYEIALVHASRGELDQAFGWFDRAYRQHDSELLWVKVDPLVKNVQSDPRFSALLKKLELPNKWSDRIRGQ